jgi:hypothetical protein
MRRLLLAVVVMVGGCEGPAGPAGGDGATTVVATTDEPAGPNCEFGGTKVTAGVDADDDGLLDGSEVSSTSYVCDGEGRDALVATSSEAAGANCPFGGTRVETGLDANHNGKLDAA